MSDAKLLLPPATGIRPGTVVRRIAEHYPRLTRRGLLHWARSTRASSIWEASKILRRWSIRPPGVEKASGRMPNQPSSGPGVYMDLVQAMVEAMGVSSAGNRPLVASPHGYLLLPHERPAGVPPVGILVCENCLNLFISEGDAQPVAAWLAPSVIAFLQEAEGVNVLFHLLTKRVLAYGGAPEAVAASHIPPDLGFVVWQWADDGLVAAAGYSRDYRVHSTISLRQPNQKAEWEAIAGFMTKSTAFDRVAIPTMWRQLAEEPVFEAPQPSRKRASRTPVEEPPAVPEAPVRDPRFDRKVEKAHNDPQIDVLPVISSLEVASEQPPNSLEVASVESPPQPHTAKGKVAAERAKLKRHLGQALALGNLAWAESVQKDLDALENA